MTLKCHVLLQSSALSGLGKQNKIEKMSPNSLLVTNISLAWILNMQDYIWRFYLKMQVNHQNLQWFKSKTFNELWSKDFSRRFKRQPNNFAMISLFGPLVPFILCKSHSGVPMTWKGLAQDITGVTNSSDLLNCCPIWCFCKYLKYSARHSQQINT